MTSSSETFSPDTTNNKITITGLCTSAITTNTVNVVQITSITNPPQKKSTGTAELIVKTSAGAGIMQKTTGLELAESDISTGAVGSITTTPAATLVQSATILQVSFTPAHNLITTSRVVITYPSTLSFGDTCVISARTGLDDGLTCTIDTTALTFTLESPFGTNTYTGGTALSLTFDNLQNPNSVQTIGAFTIATYNLISSTAYGVDSSSTSSTPYTMTAGTIIQPMSITPGDLAANSVGVTYTISFTTSHTIPASGKVKVTFPSAITVGDTSAASSSCQASAGF